MVQFAMTLDGNINTRSDNVRLLGSSYLIHQASLMAIVGAWVLVLILHQLSIGGTWDPVSLNTWVWAILWVAALSLGFVFSAGRSGLSKELPTVFLADSSINRLLILNCIVVIIGVALFVFDFAILRGYGFSTSAAAIRNEEVNAAVTGGGSSSLYSGIARIFIPAILPLIVLAVRFWSRISPQAKALIALTVVLLLLQQLLFEGGRFLIASIIVCGVFCYFSYGSASSRGASRKRKIPVLRLIFIAIVVLTFFSYVFVNRALERGDFFATAYIESVKSYNITAAYDQLYMFEGPFGGLWYSLCMLWLYATQGINELDLILRQPYLEHAYGLYQFPHLAQAILLTTGIDVRYNALVNLPTYGSYATFYGHSFVDFGNYGSLVQALILGYFTSRGILDLTNGRAGALALSAPILLTLCLFSPIISLVPTIWPALVWAMLAGRALQRTGR